MTLRHDSAELTARRGEDGRTTAYYFYGPKEDNTHRHGPSTVGTVDGDTIIVRGFNPGSATLRTEQDLANTFVHEASHILVSSYGEHPETDTDAASFDRYKDEFRAYWIEPSGDFPPGSYATDAARAHAIRDHLVGTGPAPSQGGYTRLRLEYWGSADTPQSTAPDADFKRQVDAHTAPDGFNLENNPRLDRLFQLLRDYDSGLLLDPSLVPLVAFMRTELSADERRAAAASPLVQRLVQDNISGTPRRLVKNELGIP